MRTAAVAVDAESWGVLLSWLPGEAYNATRVVGPCGKTRSGTGNVINLAIAYGAERSNQMDFTEYDRLDDFELNEILWRSIKGVDAPLPPSVRRAIAFKSVTK